MCRPGLWEQMTQQNDFVVVCACAAGLFLMLGSMSLQWGMALTGMAICLPFQIAVSLSVGEPSFDILHFHTMFSSCGTDAICGSKSGDR